MITDDARIVDARSCQLESWVRRNPDGPEYWALPGCNPWGEVEFTLGGGRLGGRDPAHVGLVQAKTLVRTLEQGSVAWGLAAGATRTSPSSSVEPYFYAPATWAAVPDRLFLHLNLGARRDTVPAQPAWQRTWGVGVEAVLTSRVGVIAETFSQDRARTYYQAGWRVWLVPDRMQIDATAGNRTGMPPGQGPERWISLGVRLLSPPFLP